MLAGGEFRRRSIVSRVQYYPPLFGSSQKLFRVLKKNAYLFTCSLGKLVEPNVEFLRECGLSDCKIAKLCFPLPRILTTKPEHVRAMVACAEGLGTPCGSGMFRSVLQAVGFLSKEKIAAKLEYLKNKFRWSDAEVGVAICKAPMLLSLSKDTLQRKSDFLISEMGLEPAYIARVPTMILCSLEGRTRPRYYVVKFLKENGLLDRNWNYNTMVTRSEKTFVETFIHPHKEAAPHLAEDYAAACRGEVPARLIFP